MGGSPLRVLRLSSPGAALIDSWAAGRPVGDDAAQRSLAGRLVDAGVAHPIPPTPKGTTLPSCAIVIPARDDQAGLSATLAALLLRAPAIPVHVVDDGSSPPLTVAYPGVELRRRAEPGGPAAARNVGWRAAVADGAEIVVFIDAGCVPGIGWLEPLLAHFSDPTVGGAAPRVVCRRDPATPARLACYELRHSPLDMGPHPASVRPGSAVAYVPTALLALRRTALEECGGFRESMRFGEDVDLVWRLHRAGWRVRYEPAVTATHPARQTYRAWVLQRFRYGTSAGPLARRHGRAVAPLAAQPWSIGTWLLVAAGYPLLGAAVTAATAEALARRAKGDPVVAAELRRLAVTGTIGVGSATARARRRAWLPVALPAGAAAWRWCGRRTRLALLLSAVAVACGRPPGGSADDRPLDAETDGCPPGAPGDRLLGLADDLAYQAGVWRGVLTERSLAALRPRFRDGPPRRRGPWRGLARDGRQRTGAFRRTSSAARPV
ncbi:MAG: mycofactocin biosynthesis glycosyltransferase MftF [Acidobacteriota bacterium]|nr:mycofactocin biosynthesis glycosyltransferase MftF [Acidobacteriota bacterium]